MFNLLFDLLVTIFYYLIWRKGTRILRRFSVGLRLKPCRSPQPPPADCPLLRLPGELILRISDMLLPDSLVFLAQSCHQFHVLLETSTATALQTISRQSRIEQISFLWRAAHDKADLWCCEVCAALHPAVAHDQICGWVDGEEDVTIALAYCGNGHEGKCHRWYCQGMRNATSQSGVQHRHIQLALKYDRKQRSNGDVGFYQRYYLKRLLRPRSTKLLAGYTHLPDFFSSEIRCLLYPRIATCPIDGRRHFLLLSIFPFETTIGSSDLIYRGKKVPVCPHIAIDYDPTRVWRPDFSLQRTDRCFSPYYSHSVVQRQSQDGVIFEEDVYHTSCARCPTDLVRHADGWYVYQDFGSEGPPTDLAWQVHLCFVQAFSTTVPKEYNHKAQGPIVHHEAGSVMTLYKSEDSEFRDDIILGLSADQLVAYIFVSVLYFGFLLFPHITE